MPFLLLFVFSLGLVFLTLIRVIQSWRTAKGSLQAALAKHNIFYYTRSLFLSTVNVFMPVFVLAILATRMHLHLWHSDCHVHGSDTLVYISTFDLSPADCTV
ncbi:uncharacterized protein BJ212DRAFT_616688 [Suillus subaureus]|uniref:Uncharacterized protein n=1 Tax=Suillus subaureus TaxID=48587 RepID=A0A9P7E2I1_9AGAM|nr:uncharacterized protein BJ212DRAFT_616688 [Suillus subaureus]KAG1809114.1 hypothetical protein BJ212DRAFT_616688 [Suillus subaureus]